MTFTTTPRASYFSAELQAGKHLFTDFVSTHPASLAVIPSDGATVFVNLTLSQPAKIAVGEHNVISAAIGIDGTSPDGKPCGVVVGEASGLVLEAPVAGVQFIVVGGTAIVEIVQ